MIKLYKGAGVLFVSENEKKQKIFFLGFRRNFPKCWSITGGGYDKDDKNLLNCALRETSEEIEINIEKDLLTYKEYHFKKSIFFDWKTFVIRVDKKEFDKNMCLGWEFSEGYWFTDLPKNSHHMLKDIIDDFKQNKIKLNKTKIKVNPLKIFEYDYKKKMRQLNLTT
jgi:8-oxo-dGTP pyrophosphatase MutT (NUDIX family)